VQLSLIARILANIDHSPTIVGEKAAPGALPLMQHHQKMAAWVTRRDCRAVLCVRAGEPRPIARRLGYNTINLAKDTFICRF